MTKFLLIGSIKFFVVMALTLTRDGKDAMVVAECGAEAIAFLKVSVDGMGWDGSMRTAPHPHPRMRGCRTREREREEEMSEFFRLPILRTFPCGRKHS
jgi:hypothetical protein